MGLRDIESTLPPGFRFFPSDEELVCHYLQKKIANERVSGGTMVEVDLHIHEPWELPEVAKLSANEWYFFSFRDRKYATGSRANRATKSGYWKATGKDRTVFDSATHAIVGMRKTLVFYSGRAPSGIKTNWIMHEFRLETPDAPPKEDWVLCRVFHKKKGDQNPMSFWNEKGNNYSTACPSSMFIESSPPDHLHDQLMPDVCYEQILPAFPDVEHQGENASSFLSLSALHQNFLDFPQEMDRTAAKVGVGTRGGGDEYELMLDVMALEDDHHALMGGGMAINLDNARFQRGKDQFLF